ncbi:MAG TPA: FAD-dependent oxidoreductase [Vicinamibacterales bacterium]|nr:FAD-dependent oxidoreductase [Vicinamibacterales bacterium]
MRHAARHRSFWLQEVAGDAPDALALEERTTADIAIVGGGFVGLWTAIRIKEAEPSCDVVLLEQDICGGGASGRNGGFVLSWWPKLASLSRLLGSADAVRVARDSEAAIEEIRQFCLTHRIDADFRRGGWLWTATTRAQLGAWDSLLRTCARAGVEPFHPISPADVARRSGSAVHRAGIFEGTAAIVQPAALARGLRRVALERGVRIFEQTRVRRFSRARPVELETETGAVSADRLVIATNAWAAGIRELARAIAVISSDMVVTAPIAGELDRIGWDRDLSITDSQTMVDYYRVTRDGRIAFGKGGWTIAFGGRIGSAFDRHPVRSAEVTADLRRYYPMLASAPVTHEWSGPIDRTSDSLPLLGYLDGRSHIVYGIGWSGNGVGPSVIGGRVLAALALGAENEWSRYPLVGRSVRMFPPEPIKFLGAHIVRTAVVRKERAERLDAAPSWLSRRLAALAPAGLEDKQ